MTPVITLAGIVLVPAVLLMVLRINATLVFLSLCLGNILVQFAADDVSSLIALFSARVPEGVDTSNHNISLVLLLLPTLLTALFMIKTVRGNGKLALNLLPAAGVGLLGALLVVPLLPGGLSHNIMDSSIWSQIQSAQGTVVGAAATICLLVLWMQRPKTGRDDKHKKH
ncbi:MAG: hypothetical protein JWO35_874 [Candidatus Saccharibacteria bacterium]|nr:hypothetical protein [Candidatus Saccharibacteria bacterium]